MPYNLYLCFILTLVCINVNCFSNIQQKRIQLMYEQGAIRHSSLNRFRRQSPVLGYKNYMQEAAARPVVVIPGVSPLYRGPGSSYGPGSSAGVPSGVSGPTVVVNMPDDNYITPVVNSPYAIPSRRL